MVRLHKVIKNTWFLFLVLFLISGIYCSSAWAVTHTGSVSGTVMDGLGDPVEGLIVEVWSNPCWDTLLGNAATDALGNYQVENLPAQNVYVNACPDCTNINYIYEWWDGADGTTYCRHAAAVAVEQDLETPDIDFALSEGPRRIDWTEINVNQGDLTAGFGILPGFDHLIVSATVTGPAGFSHEFDLETDVFAWLNECSYLVAWSKGFGDTFVYGEYTITIDFQDGVQVSESYDLQPVDLLPVDISSMSHTVNPDGSIDFSWTSPQPGQVYQARIYQNGERVYRSGMLKDMEALQVSANQLRCVVPGVEAVWEVRTYDDNVPENAVERSGYKAINYTPSDLENRSQFAAVKSLGNPDQLWLYFNVRPGSRDQVTSAVVTGPEGFAPHTFDLVNDWTDLSTGSRTLNGWYKARSAATEPILDGEYTLTTAFDDGYVETRFYTLSADDITPVDADTMGYEIFENGAIWFYWSLPQGGSGQRYAVGIRSKDGSREYARSNAGNAVDSTSRYFSVWDLRALPQGDQFTWFVRGFGPDDGDTHGDTWSNQLLTYNPFDITARGGNAFVLTATSPDLAVTAGSDVIVYGTAEVNQITLAAGAKAELINFAGENMVTIQSDPGLFTISRSGVTVTFEGTDGTLLKIPATLYDQTIVFDQEVMVLRIQDNQVMLNDEVI